MNISCKQITWFLFLLANLVVVCTIPNKVYACGGGGSSPDGIALKLRGVGNLAEAIKLKAALQKNKAIKLPDYLTFKIDNLINGSDGERLRSLLNELPGVTTSAIDLDTKEVTINYYEGWIRFARKILKTLEDNGFKAVVPVETVTFKTEGMTEVEAHDVRAYLLGVFGVSNSNIDIENNEVKVSFYQGWTTKEKLIKTIEDRGNTTVKQDLVVLKTS